MKGWQGVCRGAASSKGVRVSKATPGVLTREINFKMKNQAGEWVVSPEEKLSVFAEYYGELYTSDHPSWCAFEDYFFNL